MCLWGRLVGGVKKVPVCDWALLELGQDAPAGFLLLLPSSFILFSLPSLPPPKSFHLFLSLNLLFPARFIQFSIFL